MEIETERRFRLTDRQALVLLSKYRPSEVVFQKQVYLANDDHITIRVRQEEERFTLTVKGKKDENGSGIEFEHELDVYPGFNLLICPSLHVGEVVKKMRYELFRNDDICITLDLFTEDNAGLIILECEGTPREVQKVDFLKDFPCTAEVTNDHRYSCSQLAVNPYRNWAEGE